MIGARSKIGNVVIYFTAVINLNFSTVFFETYGCQMNVNDTEIAWSILQKKGYLRAKELTEVKTKS